MVSHLFSKYLSPQANELQTLPLIHGMECNIAPQTFCL
jgi:hypothetical protein